LFLAVRMEHDTGYWVVLPSSSQHNSN